VKRARRTDGGRGASSATGAADRTAAQVRLVESGLGQFSMHAELEKPDLQSAPANDRGGAPMPAADAGARTASFEKMLIILSRYRETSIAAVAIVLVIYFQFGSHGQFLSAQLLSVVLRETGRLGLIAVAEVMLMITGEIDLSVSGTFSIAPYIMALMAVGWGVPLPIGAAVGMAIGVLVGLINGLITVRFRVPSLITTVGVLFLLQGIVVSIYNSQPIVAPVQEPFNAIFGESLYDPADSLVSWHGLTNFTPFLWAVLIIAALALVLNGTTFGLHTIATGSNLVGAKEVGIRTDRIKVYNFMIAGGCAAFAGIINTAQFTSADPQAGSPSLTLQAIAAAVIGGTSLLGGSGTAIGALIGAFVVATLNNGLVMVGAQATVSDVYLGIAIVAAMILNVQLDRLRTRRRK
jgi:simple sugar transport system permease protein